MNTTTVGYLIVLFVGVAVGMAIEELMLQPARELQVVEVPVQERPGADDEEDDANPLRHQIERAKVDEANRQAARRAAGGWMPAGGPLPKLLVEEPTFDFGKRESGEKVTHAFILRNVGTAPLIITKVTPINGETVAKTLNLKIAPGEQAELNVTLDLTRQKGRKIRQILVQSNDPSLPVLRLAVIGTAVSGAKGDAEGSDESRIGGPKPTAITAPAASR